MTREQFAVLMGVTPRTLDRWLNGYGHMNNYDLAKASLLLGVSVFFLLDLTSLADLPPRRNPSEPFDIECATSNRLAMIEAMRRITNPDCLIRHKERKVKQGDDVIKQKFVETYRLKMDYRLCPFLVWGCSEYNADLRLSDSDDLEPLSEWDKERMVEELDDEGRPIGARVMPEHEYALKIARESQDVLDSIEGDYRDLLEVAICILRHTAEIDECLITDILAYDVIAASQRLSFLPETEYGRDLDSL